MKEHNGACFAEGRGGKRHPAVRAIKINPQRRSSSRNRRGTHFVREAKEKYSTAEESNDPDGRLRLKKNAD